MIVILDPISVGNELKGFLELFLFVVDPGKMLLNLIVGLCLQLKSVFIVRLRLDELLLFFKKNANLQKSVYLSLGCLGVALKRVLEVLNRQVQLIGSCVYVTKSGQNFSLLIEVWTHSQDSEES